MDLFGGSQALTPHQRVDGATVNQDFNKSIKRVGGSNNAYGRAVQAETQELFDCDVDQLYNATGGRKGDRSTLPKEVQKAYVVNESLSTHRLNGTEYKGSQKQKDDAIVEDVQDTATRVRQWLPW
jgi:ubiquitin C-terminal hydrolase